ncbi:hypothetical protein EZV73_05880 [Acidaminobacter sp. JC074]|uniref:hypothetical protein n=1 Tax=Acidaminobacter sp. JC074 TaxID=2530199 RepID=UPI001F1069EB|nr:hypothetical protein [Acidaminobacter sp. JC074]MCH4887088.1 hypothetical protein [Acidaminobacter sp. JC074]
MLEKLKPFLLAVVIAIVIQTITFFVPDYNSGENQEKEQVIIEEIRKSIDYEAYLKALPFSLGIEDKEALEVTFEEIVDLFNVGKKDQVKGKLDEIEQVLDKYWYSEDYLSKLVDIEIDDQFLLYEDAENLKKLKEKIFLDRPIDKNTLFKSVGLFYEKYYESLNNLYSTYRDEIKNNQLIVLELEDKIIKKIKAPTVTEVDYDYETFLNSRLFMMTDEVYTNMYDDFMKAKLKGDQDAIKEMHERMKDFWFDKDIKKSFLPIETYKLTFSAFKEADVK